MDDDYKYLDWQELQHRPPCPDMEGTPPLSEQEPDLGLKAVVYGEAWIAIALIAMILGVILFW